MKITSTEEYGLRCLLQVARSQARPLGIQEIASAEALSAAYAGKLLHLLKKSGLITSHRGPKGGYVLACPAREITMARVIQSLTPNDTAQTDLCGQFTGDRKECVHLQETCSLRTVWGRILHELWEILENVTIADLIDPSTGVIRLVPSSNSNEPPIPRDQSGPRTPVNESLRAGTQGV